MSYAKVDVTPEVDSDLKRVEGADSLGVVQGHLFVYDSEGEVLASYQEDYWRGAVICRDDENEEDEDHFAWDFAVEEDGDEEEYDEDEEDEEDEEL